MCVYMCFSLSLFGYLLHIIFLLFFTYSTFFAFLNLHLYNRPNLLHALTQVHTVDDVVSVKPFISFKRMLFKLSSSSWWFAELYVLGLSFLKSLSPIFLMFKYPPSCLNEMKLPQCLFWDLGVQVSQVALTFL